jgi:hypothetical protein
MYISAIYILIYISTVYRYISTGGVYVATAANHRNATAYHPLETVVHTFKIIALFLFYAHNILEACTLLSHNLAGGSHEWACINVSSCCTPKPLHTYTALHPPHLPPSLSPVCLSLSISSPISPPSVLTLPSLSLSLSVRMYALRTHAA